MRPAGKEFHKYSSAFRSKEILCTANIGLAKLLRSSIVWYLSDYQTELEGEVEFPLSNGTDKKWPNSKSY